MVGAGTDMRLASEGIVAAGVMVAFCDRCC